MRFLLDTNIISELRKGARCNKNVAAWFVSVDEADLYLSVLVTGEISRGAEMIRPKNPAQAKEIERWLGEVEAAFSERILPVDKAVAREWGRMSAVRTLPVVDALLAATASVNQMTLVTRNGKDIAGLGASILNPFDFETR